MRLRWIACALALAVAAPAVAQERIVVTAQKVRDDLGGDYVIPHVGITRRADFLLRRLDVSCDTREAQARADELRQTLRGMLADAARDDAIVLSRLVEIAPGDRYGDADILVAPFTEDAIDASFRSNYGGRSDTSYVQLLVKTPIGEDDTLESATARLEEFVAGVRRVGRSALDLNREDSLSVVDPAQYRDEIFATMSADAEARLGALGEGYAAAFEGLENQVSWYRADILELRLFIPHRFAIRPAE